MADAAVDGRRRRRRKALGDAAGDAAGEAGNESDATATSLGTTAAVRHDRPPAHLPALPSSFASVPAIVLTGVGVAPPLGVHLGRTACSVLLARFANPLRPEPGNASADPGRLLLGALLADGPLLPLHIWAVLQSVFCWRWRRPRQRPPSAAPALAHALPYLVAAIVLNHARRTLFFGRGAVGFYLLPQPDEAWRLLLARPDVFVEDALRAVEGAYPPLRLPPCQPHHLPLRLLVFSLQKRVWDVLAGGLPAVLLLANEAAAVAWVRAALGPLPAAPAVARTLVRRAQNVAAVLFLVWLFSCIEFAIAQTSASLALATAVARAPPATTLRAASSHWPAAAALGWQLLAVYPVAGLLPLVVRAGLGCTLRDRQPGVLLVLAAAVAAMHTLLRQRARLYIAIETSGLFVFLAYAGVSALLALAVHWEDARRDQRWRAKKKQQTA